MHVLHTSQIPNFSVECSNTLIYKILKKSWILNILREVFFLRLGVTIPGVSLRDRTQIFVKKATLYENVKAQFVFIFSTRAKCEERKECDMNVTLFWILFVAMQQTFERRFNVAFMLMWRRDVAQPQINVETTLRLSTLKFTTLSNVELMLPISTLTWTTLGNVETTL